MHPGFPEKWRVSDERCLQRTFVFPRDPRFRVVFQFICGSGSPVSRFDRALAGVRGTRGPEAGRGVQTQELHPFCNRNAAGGTDCLRGARQNLFRRSGGGRSDSLRRRFRVPVRAGGQLPQNQHRNLGSAGAQPDNRTASGRPADREARRQRGVSESSSGNRAQTRRPRGSGLHRAFNSGVPSSFRACGND